MEHIDNDMDDLFKKAGELYPLKISGSDWEGVAAKFQDKTADGADAGAGTVTRGASGRRRWRLLALLIPMGLAGLLYTNHLVNQKHKAATAADNNNNAVKNSGDQARPMTKADQPGSQQTAVPGTKGLSNTEQTSPSGNKGNAIRNSQGNSALGGSRNSRYSSTGKTPGSNIVANSTSGSDRGNQAGYANPEKADATSGAAASNNMTSSVPAAAATAVPDAATANTGATSAGDQNKTSKTADTSKAVTANNAAPVKKTDSKKKSSRGIYAGVVLGPDWSTVHMQSVNQLGYSVGITAGYRFNERLAIETGLLWDRKYYYSKGEYFNTKNIYLQPYWNISSVDGNCNMWEIPLALRYDFSSRGNHSFFAKAGFSSYIMTKQNYSFGLDSGNVQRTTRYIPYDNTLSYFFSIVQVSAGYEHTIGRNTFIRVEPYVKIPLQGVGTGSMPISSLGIYFGITHSFR